MSTGTMELVDLSTLIDVPITCEHSGHIDDSEAHGGDAQWIQRLGPCKCGDPGPVFVCHKWRDWVREAAKRNSSLRCPTCWPGWPAAQVTFERI